MWDELKTLSKDNMKAVAGHIESAYLFLDEDLEAAVAHAETAVRRAGRVASARECLGIVRYSQGEWHEALRELRTATRLSGQAHLLPMMADCERGLGRPEKALELADSREAARLQGEALVEMAIVLSGAHRDLGNPARAVEILATPAARIKKGNPEAGRLWFAHAEALADAGSPEAPAWYAKAASVGETGQPKDRGPQDGVFMDLEDGAPDLPPEPEAPTPAESASHDPLPEEPTEEPAP